MLRGGQVQMGVAGSNREDGPLEEVEGWPPCLLTISRQTHSRLSPPPLPCWEVASLASRSQRQLVYCWMSVLVQEHGSDTAAQQAIPRAMDAHPQPWELVP